MVHKLRFDGLQNLRSLPNVDAGDLQSTVRLIDHQGCRRHAQVCREMVATGAQNLTDLSDCLLL